MARRFAREGLPVALIARTKETVAAAAEAIDSMGVRALPLVADAADETALHAALDTAAGELGEPDIAVYNAAVIRPDTVGELTHRDHLDTYAVNVLGPSLPPRTPCPRWQGPVEAPFPDVVHGAGQGR
ncbi:SDR family NAD(P)-dependent oxidoreductase [Streptomyces werraensis]|uniref:SDR family NAD(P)-dependent oxidoreductase n=1 Tax=Streptomyces werraensis TaxID=68284 RepID=UPI00381E2652